MKNKFKPVKEEKEIISLRISTSLLNSLDEKSNEYNMSRNELIIQSIQYALENMDNEWFLDNMKKHLSDDSSSVGAYLLTSPHHNESTYELF